MKQTKNIGEISLKSRQTTPLVPAHLSLLLLLGTLSVWKLRVLFEPNDFQLRW